MVPFLQNTHNSNLLQPILESRSTSMTNLVDALLRNALSLPDDIKHMSPLRQQNVDLFVAVLSCSHLLDDAFAHSDGFSDFRL